MAARQPELVASNVDDRSAADDGRVIKRIRTRRACDECRSRKIRCQYSTGREAVGSCEHCDVHGLRCGSTTLSDRRAATGQKRSVRGSWASSSKRPRGSTRRINLQQSSSGHTSTSDDSDDSEEGRTENNDGESNQGFEARFHSGASVHSLLASLLHDSRPNNSAGSSHYHSSGMQGGGSSLDDPDRIHFYSLRSNQPSVLVTLDDAVDESGKMPDSVALKRSSTEERVASHFLSESVLESLVALYRMRVVPVNPVVSISETSSLFAWIHKPDLNSTPPTPLPRLLRLIICAVPAQWRAVPRDIRQSLRVTISSQFANSQMTNPFGPSSLGNLQTLLVLSMGSDILAASKQLNWLNTGLAIRMGQEIGLHRELPPDLIPLGQRNRRKRVWAACQIADAWYTASAGLPPVIDPSDGDVGPPFPFPDHVTPAQTAELEPCFQTHVHIWQLSLILRRILKALYGPQGLAQATDPVLYKIEQDLRDWERGLPDEAEHLCFQIFDSGNTNFIKLLSCAVEGIFVLVFLRDNQSLPATIHFRPDPARLTKLLQRSGEAIEWLSKEGQFYLDVWHITLYCLVVCTALHSYEYTRTGNSATFQRLKLAQKNVRMWAKPSEGEPPRNRSWIASDLATIIERNETSRPNDVAPQPSGRNPSAVSTSPLSSTQALEAGPLPFFDGGLDPVLPSIDFSTEMLFDGQPDAFDESKMAEIMDIFQSVTNGMPFQNPFDL